MISHGVCPGHLLTIESMEEADFVQKNLGLESNERYWIAALYARDDGVCTWEAGPSDGSVFWNTKDTKLTPGWSPWAEGHVSST